MSWLCVIMSVSAITISSAIISYSLHKKMREWQDEIPLPHSWEECRQYFKCSTYGHDKMKPLPTMEYWHLLRETYLKHVDPDIIFDDVVLPTEGYNFANGRPPPYYAGHGERGRGIFASRDITKGELVHDGSKSDFRFPDGVSWRRLVFNLPKQMSCDVIDWSWVQKTEENDEYKLFSAINISIFFNGGNKRTVNVNPPSGASSKFYALRDINKDEELLTDYGIYDNNWKAAGL